MTAIPRIAVFALGGTIASRAEPGRGATVRIPGHELVSSVPEIAAVARVETHATTMVPSGDLSMLDLLAVRSSIAAAVESGIDGIVILQGTDTLEESAYALELLTDHDVPVVVTGAMRTFGAPGSDGAANLLAAVRVAANPDTRGMGVLVVFNDEIHAARLARKGHTSSPATFVSPGLGPVGYVSEDRVRILLRPVGRFTIRLPETPPTIRVAQALTYLGDDGELIDAVPALGYDGLVLAGLGGGHVPARVAPIVKQVAEAIPVVLASRTGAGEGLRRTYAFRGSETDLLGAGIVSAVNLGTAHAGVLLGLLLMAGVDRRSLAQSFERASDPRQRVGVPA